MISIFMIGASKVDLQCWWFSNMLGGTYCQEMAQSLKPCATDWMKASCEGKMTDCTHSWLTVFQQVDVVLAVPQLPCQV